jgi:hypothetical protein
MRRAARPSGCAAPPGPPDAPRRPALPGASRACCAQSRAWSARARTLFRARPAVASALAESPRASAQALAPKSRRSRSTPSCRSSSPSAYDRRR